MSHRAPTGATMVVVGYHSAYSALNKKDSNSTCHFSSALISINEKVFGSHFFIADTHGLFSFWRVWNEGLACWVKWAVFKLSNTSVLSKSLIMHGFHFSVSLTFHINDHLLPDGKAMMVSNEVCPYQCSTWLTGLLWENRPLGVFSKD